MSSAKASNSVGPIIFSNETAREQLKSESEVVTFRKDSRTTGDTWWRETRLGTKEGDVKVREIEQVDPVDDGELQEYQGLSGFNSTQEWQEAIRRLNGELPRRGFLYRVSLRSDE